jgi:diguanylate cyclase (GGDEF)-like protein
MTRRAFECELPGAPEEFAAMVDEGRRHSWPEVVRAGLYGLLRHSAEPGGDGAFPATTSLLQQAQLDGDADMVALALTWRAWLALVHGGGIGGSADDDIAKAAVMLEKVEGDAVIKATAHFRLAFSFLQLRLWELADEQYAAAESMVDAVDPYAKDPLLHRAALAYNRVMVQVDWACSLRQVGDAPGIDRRREAQVEAVAAAEGIDMPSEWRDDVRVATLVLDLLAGADRASEVRAYLEDTTNPRRLEVWRGYLHLALSLQPESVGLAVAAEQAEKAVMTIDSRECSAVHSLALYQATVLEAALAGRETAGVRSARAYAAEREEDRLRNVAAMRAVIATQRMRGERDLLARHANIDPLSGLANRRGFDGHVEQLRSQGVEQVAMLLFDVDHFKQVNDRYGHAAGDSVLQRVSAVLTANVRSGDFAARFGGDEFVLVLADSGIVAATRRSDVIAAEIAEQTWADIDPLLRVTLSVGVAAGHSAQIADLTRQADAALYQAKAARAPSFDLTVRASR